MKSHKYCLDIKSPQSFFKASEILAAVKLHCELLPEYLPQKWGWYEPLDKVFNPGDLEELVTEVNSIFWKRRGKHRAEGSWMIRWVSAVDFIFDTHASIGLKVYESDLQDKLLRYMKATSLHTQADFSFLDSLNPQYLDNAMLSDWSLFGSDTLSVTTHILRHWLPDMPWAVVFGPAYVQMFGKDHLLKTPAYLVEDLGNEQVFIQLTPRIEDIHEQFDAVMNARSEAKRHLGEECFFKPELAYDYKEHHEKAGKVFRVPAFHLQSE